MSRWVHVAALFRIDALGEQSFEDVFGKDVLFPAYDDPDYEAKEEEFDKRMADQEKHPEDYLPCGSEGSLAHGVVVNTKNSLPHYEVMVVGDLRDFYDDVSIVEWFHRSCDRIKWLRQAVIHIKPTHGEDLVFVRRK